MNTEQLLAAQRRFYNSGATIPVDFRISMLKKLYSCIKENEGRIAAALKTDLGKCPYEAFMCETGLVLSEIRYMIKHIRKYARPHRVHTPLAQFISKSCTTAVPYGNVLIMSPWNYPLLLTLDPLVNAIAAGNTAIVKPSAYSPASGALIRELISCCFDEEYIAVVMGGREENANLLSMKFDFIFFTGSQNVGREVLRKAAGNLTPVVLELGGKSPCIVDDTANISLAARRIVFGKFLNCGQTCVAPDYILCDSKIKNHLIEEIKKQIRLQYGDNPLDNPDYGKIINKKHFERITGLIDSEKTILGGIFNPKTLQIAPTLMDNVTFDDAVMKEEIFGPVMPFVTFDSFNEVPELLKGLQKPLALYLFSSDKAHIKYVERYISYGGGCINDTIIHLATSEMGFGGVGESGMGSYHGRTGFEAFSHIKSIVDKKTLIDLPMRYPNCKSRLNNKLLHMFLR